jgi:Ser/Thr protein kinase RdoA (MazF antagonist)
VKSHLDYLQEILQEWGIIALSINNMEGGIVNTNYLIATSQENYILRKVSKWKKNDYINNEFLWLIHLNENEDFNVEIPYPLLTTNNKFYVDDTSAKYWLYRYIDGEIKEKLTLMDCKAVINLIAKLHNISLNYQDGKHNDELQFKIKGLASSLEKQMIVFNDNTVIQKKLKDLRAIMTSSKLGRLIDEASFLPEYNIHRDIHPSNLIWKDSKIIGLIDFEHYPISSFPLIYDLCPLLNAYKQQNGIFDKNEIKRLLFHYKSQVYTNNYGSFHLLPLFLIIIAVEGYNYYLWLLKNNEDKAKLSRLENWYSNALYYNDLLDQDFFLFK